MAGDVTGLVVRDSVLPTAVDDALPLERLAAEGGKRLGAVNPSAGSSQGGDHPRADGVALWVTKWCATGYAVLAVAYQFVDSADRPNRAPVGIHERQSQGLVTLLCTGKASGIQARLSLLLAVADFGSHAALFAADLAAAFAGFLCSHV